MSKHLKNVGGFFVKEHSINKNSSKANARPSEVRGKW